MFMTDRQNSVCSLENHKTITLKVVFGYFFKNLPDGGINPQELWYHYPNTKVPN